jgi:hypothetical protein
MPMKQTEPRSSAGLVSATGRDRSEWFAALDEWGAPNRSYRAIADWLTTEHGVSAWWAQKLIVEYEQDRGIRQPGARPDGTFAGGASKTLAAPVGRVVEAFTDANLRGRWLTDLELSERTSQPGRSIRFDVADGSRVSVVFEDKGNRTQVAVEQERLPTAAAAERAKSAWREWLTSLKALLEDEPETNR